MLAHPNIICAEGSVNLCRLFFPLGVCVFLSVCKVKLCVCCTRLDRNCVYPATDGSRALLTAPRSRPNVSPAGGEMDGGGGITKLIISSPNKSAENGLTVSLTQISQQNSQIEATVPMYLLLKLLLVYINCLFKSEQLFKSFFLLLSLFTTRGRNRVSLE